MNVSDHLLDWFYGCFWLGYRLKRSDCYLHYEVRDIAQFQQDQGQYLTGSECDYYRKDGVRFCLISDTHDRHSLFPQLPLCDILIHTGDILMTGRCFSRDGSIAKLRAFNEWIGKQSAKYRIVIGGNHDSILEELDIDEIRSILCNAIYLCNSEVTIMGLRIFGSPLSYGFSKNRAFQSPWFAVDTIAASRALHGSPVDVLVTHGRCPSIGRIVQPTLLHVTGHLHRLHGVQLSSLPDRLDKPSRSFGRRVTPLYVSSLEHVVSGESCDNSWLKASAPIMDPSYQPSQVPIILDFTQLQMSKCQRTDLHN